MAEAIGLASGLVALSVFAFQASVSLHQIIDSFQTSKKAIRELKEELEALNGVLKSLQQAAADNTEALSALNFPLFRCGKACRDFEGIVNKCTAHSGGSRTSFRDWARLTYLGGDIAGFKNMIAGYKATINIALADANFRVTAVTSTVLEEYKEMIANTTSDLEDHLKEINDKLQALSQQGSGMSDKDAAEREQVQEEKDSTKQCLTICALVSEHINQVQPLAFKDVSAAQQTHQVIVARLKGLISAKQVTANVLKDCKDRLTEATTDLERHLQEIENRQKTISLKAPKMSDEDRAEQERAQEEKESIKQCLSICAEASQQIKENRTNVFEDISIGDNSHQVIVATLGDLISAKRVTAGDGGMQWLGQMSDSSLQQLSRAGRMESPNGTVATDKATEPQTETTTKFEGHYDANSTPHQTEPDDVVEMS